VGHAPIPTGAKLLRCIGLHAYPTGVATLRYNQQRNISKINTKDNRAFQKEMGFQVIYNKGIKGEM